MNRLQQLAALMVHPMVGYASLPASASVKGRDGLSLADHYLSAFDGHWQGISAGMGRASRTLFDASAADIRGDLEKRLQQHETEQRQVLQSKVPQELVAAAANGADTADTVPEPFSPDAFGGKVVEPVINHQLGENRVSDARGFLDKWRHDITSDTADILEARVSDAEGAGSRHIRFDDYGPDLSLAQVANDGRTERRPLRHPVSKVRPAASSMHPGNEQAKPASPAKVPHTSVGLDKVGDLGFLQYLAVRANRNGDTLTPTNVRTNKLVTIVSANSNGLSQQSFVDQNGHSVTRYLDAKTGEVLGDVNLTTGGSWLLNDGVTRVRIDVLPHDRDLTVSKSWKGRMSWPIFRIANPGLGLRLPTTRPRSIAERRFWISPN